MKMVRLYFYFMTLLSCGNVPKNDINMSDDTVIIGQAMDAKAGAVVIASDDKKMYYIDGLDSWDEEIYGKIVKVSGKISIEELKEDTLKTIDIIPQQMLGIKRTILMPKWGIVD
jgi:hypothetical protein